MGFPRLLSIFYCTFHPIQGPKVLYEVPEGSILSKTSPLVDFDSISEYLIPKVELCSKLVTISTPTCKVIGFPINLEHKKFQRNALMFNLAFVFDKDAEISSYEPVVRKMARVLKALEKESEFLSRQTRLAMMDNGTLANLSVSAAATAPATSTGVHSSLPPPPVALTTTQSAPLLPTSSSTLVAPPGPPDQSQMQSDSSTGAEGLTNATASMSVSDTGSGTNGTSSPPTSAGLSAPVDPTSSTAMVSSSLPPVAASLANPAPTSITATPITITSSSIVSSPPSMASNPISSVLTAPASSSPFPPAKQTSTTGQRQTSTASATPVQQSLTDGSGMQNLIEQLIEDLNSYCECQIPIDSANTINLKLFPTYPNPAPVYDYQVPISTVNLEALTDVNWDMTMQRITGYINGVNSVKRIAEYADVETGLARMCMEHLLYYGCIIMVDLFQFRNIYAVKMEMMRLTEDVALQNECVNYVTMPDMHLPSFAKVFSLYCSLQYGVVLQDWIEQNQIADYNIDVRRFISFGVIKGFLYRVHKYPILDYHDPAIVGPSPAGSKPEVSSAIANQTFSIAMTPSAANGIPPHRKMYGDTLAPTDQNGYFSHNPQQYQQQNHHQPSSPSAAGSESNGSVVIPPVLKKLLNGEHHYDELCTQFGCSVREMDQILATDSRVKFIYR